MSASLPLQTAGKSNWVRAKLVQKVSYGGKPVFIVEKHQEVIEAWVACRLNGLSGRVLITLDHHTDLQAAFLRHSHQSASRSFGSPVDETEATRKQRELVAEFNPDNLQSARAAVGMLQHDEHIDLAIKAGIFEHAYVVLGYTSAVGRHPQATVLSFEPRLVSFEKFPPDGDCERERADAVIESGKLSLKINRIEAERGAIGTFDYILDVDLDVFSTAKSISPSDPATFYDLIRGARAITIARETKIVEQEDGTSLEPLKADYLLEKLLGHIELAMRVSPQ
ncbi:UPF0489 family protein [Methylocystis echinoides]|uniref:UPF0489 family protein n=1 Tax=Methylocystis echinoides TaxID=29468 RepID=UPI00343ECE7C